MRGTFRYDSKCNESKIKSSLLVVTTRQGAGRPWPVEVITPTGRRGSLAEVARRGSSVSSSGQYKNCNPLGNWPDYNPCQLSEEGLLFG